MNKNDDYILQIINIPLIDSNSYILKKNSSCIIFDMGGEDEILKYVENSGLQPLAVFLTHGHFDHITAVNNFLKFFINIKIYANIMEKDILEDPKKNLSNTMYGEDYVVKNNNIIFLNDEDVVDILDLHIKMIHTPGHTIGSSCFYIEELKKVFTGDTLFYHTYGRYDFPTGSDKQIAKSVGITLMKLPDDVIVYPGHGIQTSIKEERNNNELCRDYVIDWALKN